MFSALRILAITLITGLLFASGALAGPFILVDIKSGKVVAADRATDPWYPASITKLMTLYVLAEAVRDGQLSLTSTLTMSQSAARVQPSKMGFKPGTKVTIENALPMLIVKSANDIAGAIAERVSGSQSAFVAEMNRTAKRLGMSGSRFTNPHGLPSKGQYVTARDMALLGIAFHKNFPELLPLFDVPAIRSGKSVLRSYNLLLEHYRGASGMKTGFICSAGLNMVATAKRGQQHFIAVVLGELSTIDRTEKAALVLEHGFAGKHTKSGERIDRYNPHPTRATPVDMRPVVCGGDRKIRAYQIVAPPPKPKRGGFAQDKYVSPQRKNFGRNLGDQSHPQGALVYAPKGRKYRSHILQPREAREILEVHAGAGQRVANARFTIKPDRTVRKRNTDEAALISGALNAESTTTNAALAATQINVPKPQQKPEGLEGASFPVTASAFANANNGVGASTPERSSSLVAGLVEVDSVKKTGVIASSGSGHPIVLTPSIAVGIGGGFASGVLLPRRNPVRR